MTKKLFTLLFGLVVALFGVAAFADAPAAVTVYDPVTATAPEAADPVTPVADTPALFEPEAAPESGDCALDFSNASKPKALSGCQGGEGGSCDDNFDCRGYFCPLGSIRCCVGGTGSGCQGTCACCG